MFTEKQIKLFWTHIDKLGELDCWNWTGKKTRDGYGSIHWNSKSYSSHRVSFEISTGESPDGFEIMHSCDNKSCCNPNHLRKGTHIENMQDMINKGRQAKIFPDNKGKMNYELAEKLRQDFSVIKNKRKLAIIYNISPIHVRDILSRKCWKY